MTLRHNEILDSVITRVLVFGKTFAVFWYRKAARRGDAKAQYNLGLCYKHGEGVSRSKRWAHHWIKKAARKKLPAAIMAMKREQEEE